MALALGALATVAVACDDDSAPPRSPATSTAPPSLDERPAALLAVLGRAAAEVYGRTAVTSPRPRDRFVRQIVGRAGVLEDARAAQLPLDLLVDSYVATAGARGGGGVELLDVRNPGLARSLAAVLAAGGTPSHDCQPAATAFAGLGGAGTEGWLLTCAAPGQPESTLFLGIAATGGVVIVAEDPAPRVDQVVATVVRGLNDARLTDSGDR